MRSLLLLAAVMVPRLATATDYHVDRGHPAASDQNEGTSERPWQTIARANQSLTAGDTVYLKEGTYDTPIEPQSSGTAAQTITYRSYGTDTVTIEGITDGLRLEGRSYITVEGIHFRSLYRFLWLFEGAHHNTIAYCTFDQGSSAGAWSGSRIYQSSQFNWIHHCQFSRYGYYDADDVGCVIDLGSEEDRTDQTSFNLLEDNVFFQGGHHVMGVYATFNVIRNNYFHNEPWAMGTAASDRGAVMYGDRNLSFSGYSENGGRNLFEGNRVAYASDPPDNNGASGMALNSSHNIVRRNLYYHNIGAGLSMSLTSSYLQSIVGNRVYHNTLLHNGFNPYDPTDHMSSGIGLGIYSGSLVIANNAIKNNLLHLHRVAFDEYNINTADRKGLLALQVLEGNWDGDTQADPRFVGASGELGDPMSDEPPDLRLQADSPCIDQGAFLTTIASDCAGDGSFVVDDAGYFMDGWGIVEGDVLQLEGQPATARVVSVDYQSNVIVVDRAMTCAAGQGVALAYVGSAPDPGAYEHGASVSVDGGADGGIGPGSDAGAHLADGSADAGDGSDGALEGSSGACSCSSPHAARTDHSSLLALVLLGLLGARRRR